MAQGKVKISVDWTADKAKQGISGLKQNLKNLKSAGEKVGSTFKSVLGANLVSNAIIGTVRNITNSVKDLASEVNNSAKAWKTFEGNMRMLGKSEEEIGVAKKAMQDYATQTIYSASDMASTYSQLAAVGVSEVDKLVTGFGGLAASAENPAQAMKTLSVQATQMAAKPKVAWQDFKLMLEQAPAAMSAVAQEMGMDMQTLVARVQDGEVATEDFFNAIKKVGNSEAFAKMATEFKTIDQAVDGLRETIAVKLQGAFEKFNVFGIKVITKIADAFEKIDVDGLAERLGNFLNSIDIDKVFENILSAVRGVWEILVKAHNVAKDFIDGFKETGALNTFSTLIKELKDNIKKVLDAAKESGSLKDIGHIAGDVSKLILQLVRGLNKLSGFLLQPFVIRGITAIWLAFKGYKIVTMATGAIKSFTSAFKKIPKKSPKLPTLDVPVDKPIKNASKLGRAFSKVGSLISRVFSGISSVISRVASATGRLLQSLGRGIATVFKGLGQGISIAAKGIGTGLATAFRGLGMAIAMVPPTTWLALGAGIAIAAAGLALLATQSEGVSEILYALGDAISQIIGSITEFAVAVLPLLIQALSTFGDIVVNVIGALGGLIIDVGTSIKTVLEGIGVVIESVGTAIQSVLEGLGSAFESFGNGVRLALEGVGSVVQSVGSAIQSALQGVASVVESVGNAIKSVLEGVGSVVESVGTAVKTVLEGLGTAFEKFGNAVKTVCEGVSGIIDSIGEAIKNVLDGVANIFQSIGDAAYDAGYGFKLFAEGIEKLTNLNLGDMVATLVSLGAAIGDLTYHAGSLSLLGNSMVTFGQGFMGVAQASQIAQGSLQALPNILSTFKTAIDSLPTSLSSVATSMSTFVSGVMTSLGGLVGANALIFTFNAALNSINSIAITVASGVSMFSSQLLALSGNLSSVTSAINSLIGIVSSLVGSFDSVSNSANSMSNTISTMASTINSSMSSALSTIQNICNSITSTLQQSANKMIDEGRRAGREVVQSIVDGLRNGEGSVRNATENIFNAIRRIGESAPSIMQNIGVQISNGVANGMWSAVGSVRAAANAIVAEVERAMRAKAQIHSPSRLFANSVGRYIPEGIAMGIDKNAHVVENSLDFIKGIKYKAENVLNLGKNYAVPTMQSSNNNVTNNKTNNYEALLNIENFENNGDQDIRDIYEQIKFLIKEEGDRLS